MTFIQLEYIVAIDSTRHFGLAADQCHVTQPTLSMQVHKLEKEWGIRIFDRSRQPVVPTEAGKELIAGARRILAQRDALQETVSIHQGTLGGELRVGIIPTLAPYLLPLFIPSFTKNFPGVRLHVNELTTDQLIVRLREGRIDAGILVTPLQATGINEEPLFYEELMAYVSKNNALYNKEYVLAREIDPNKLWLLEEGHCFRSQIENLCELRKSSREGSHFEYEAGSIETLRRMVDTNDGITIMPQLAVTGMSSAQRKHLRQFRHPAPVREVSLAVHRDHIRRKLLDVLKLEILNNLPDGILRKSRNKQRVVSI